MTEENKMDKKEEKEKRSNRIKNNQFKVEGNNDRLENQDIISGNENDKYELYNRLNKLNKNLIDVSQKNMNKKKEYMEHVLNDMDKNIKDSSISFVDFDDLPFSVYLFKKKLLLLNKFGKNESITQKGLTDLYKNKLLSSIDSKLDDSLGQIRKKLTPGLDQPQFQVFPFSFSNFEQSNYNPEKHHFMNSYDVVNMFLDVNDKLSHFDVKELLAAGSLYDIRQQKNRKLSKNTCTKKISTLNQKFLSFDKNLLYTLNDNKCKRFLCNSESFGSNNFYLNFNNDSVFDTCSKNFKKKNKKRKKNFLDIENNNNLDNFSSFINSNENIYGSNNLSQLDSSINYSNQNLNMNSPFLNEFETNAIPDDYLKIKPNISSVKRFSESGIGGADIEDNSECKNLKSSFESVFSDHLDYEQIDKNKPNSFFFNKNLDPHKKMIDFSSDSSNKISTNQNLNEKIVYDSVKSNCKDDPLNTFEELEKSQPNKRYEIYKSKKLKSLEKLINLKNSTLGFVNSSINDIDLLNFKKEQEILRDENMIRLRLKQNYELLKTSFIFYQDSNKIYKHLNSTMITKLKKLFNFFKFQKKILKDFLNSSTNNNIYNIRKKKSISLYGEFSTRSYGREIKKFIKNIIKNKTNDSDLKKLSSTQILKELFFNLKGSSKFVIHDLMPLVTLQEFNMIADDSVSNKDTNEKVFQYITNKQVFSLNKNKNSYSDSSSGEGNSNFMMNTKRRGRRCAHYNAMNEGSFMFLNNGNNSNTESKLSEVSLSTMIVKNFIGPQPAKQKELISDLEMMGVKSRWPF